MTMSPRAQQGPQWALWMRLWECGRYRRGCGRGVLVVVPREERLFGRRVVEGQDRGQLRVDLCIEKGMGEAGR